MGVGKPTGLSPSSFSAFKDCPLAFRFSYLDRLPQPPSAPGEQGHARAPRARAPDAARARGPHARPTRSPTSTAPAPTSPPTPTSPSSSSPSTSGSSSTPTPRCSSASTSSSRTPPRSCRSGSSSGSPPPSAGCSCAASSTASSSTPTASSSSPTTRPAPVPSERYEIKRLAGVHMYAAMVQHVLGKRPVRVQLLYLSKPEAIITTPSEQSVTGVMRKTDALWDAIGRACERDDFRPAPGHALQLVRVQGVLPRVRRRSAAGGRAARPRAHDRAAAAAGHHVGVVLPH